MRVRQNLLSGRPKYLLGLFLLCICLICLAFTMDSGDFDMSRREILLRRIGHEILLQSGDSRSRVLPVKKIGEHEYQISFEKELTFHPDSLVNTTRRLLVSAPGTGDYIVNVLNCGSSGVAYGYAVSRNKKDDIIACLGREQPKACYLINIKFKPPGIISPKNGLFLGTLPVIAFLGFIFFRSVKRQKTVPEVQDDSMFTLGSFSFDPKNRKLITNGTTIELTGTETRLLHIFALTPNETIERTRLQKEIWEDEGVIVGRSLDVFISKLRKKLELDPKIKISVIRGKGYKLEINS